MTHKIIWDEGAVNDLMKIHKKDAQKIKNKIDNFLCLEPQKLGKPLSANLKGYYRYRFGDYRIIYEIQDVKIVIVKIGHRKDVYG